MNNEVIDERDYSELNDAIAMAQHTVYKNYLSELENYNVIKPSEGLLSEEPKKYVKMFHLERLSCKKGEDVFQKLSTVYSASMLLGCSLIVMIDVDTCDAPVHLYIGVRRNSKDRNSDSVNTSYDALKNGIMSNFPGSGLTDLKEEQLDQLINGIFGEEKANNSEKDGLPEISGIETKKISSVSCVASARDKSKTEHKTFIQGIERFIDAMKGEAYTALFIAEPVEKSEQNGMRMGYENLYSTLSAFRKSIWSYNENQSESVMTSLSKGTSESIALGTSCTRAHSLNAALNFGINSSYTDSTTWGKTKGGPTMAARIANLASMPLVQGLACSIPVVGPFAGAAVDIFSKIAAGGFKSSSVADTIAHSLGMNGGVNVGGSVSASESKSATETKTTSTTETRGNTNTAGRGRTLQIEKVNKPIDELLKRIDKHLERISECEDYGTYSCGAYFISQGSDVCVRAANTYLSLMTGDGSSIESGAINSWFGNREGVTEKVSAIDCYLRRFVHPVFAECVENEGKAECRGIYTPGTIVSGMELPLHLGLPLRSVAGLPVFECAEFGRDIVTCNIEEKSDRTLKIGKIFHMNKVENTDVDLSLQSLCSHTFITGSTGSGKSNTIYKILSEAKNLGTKFLVIEPAKGEYKHIFGPEKDIYTYGTNPEISPLLKINPFSFPKGIHILEHMDRLIEIFNVCWPMYAAMPAVLKNAVEKSYEECGWNLTESTNPYSENLYPQFSDIARNVKIIIDSSEYDKENKGAYKGSLLTRLTSLTNGINGLIFTDDEISMESLFDENVIVDLSRVGSGETKSLIMGMLVLKLQEYRMVHGEMNAQLKHITVLEEAHNLLKRTSSEQISESSGLLGKSVEMIANAIAEMRTYGEGFIIADQSPGLLDMSVIRNTNTKIIMRLPDISDRELVGKAASLNENQITELAKLPCGVAAVYQNEWLQPVLCKIDKCDLPDKKYEYCRKSSHEQIRDYKKLYYVAKMLSNSNKLSYDDILSDILPVLEKNRIKPSVQIAVVRYLENPPKEPRMTKLAPIMSELFPKVRSAVVSAYNDNSDASEWTNRAQNALLNEVNTEIDDRTRRDIIQAVITEYVYNELGNRSDIQKWAENGGLR